MKHYKSKSNKSHKNNRKITKTVKEDEMFTTSEEDLVNELNKYFATLGKKLAEQQIND